MNTITWTVIGLAYGTVTLGLWALWMYEKRQHRNAVAVGEAWRARCGKAEAERLGSIYDALVTELGYAPTTATVTTMRDARGRFAGKGATS